MKLQIKPLFGKDTIIPQYATDGSAGMDLVADNFKSLYQRGNNKEDVSELEEITLIPNARVLIGCGFAVAIRQGFEMQIRPRSGKALKEGITVLNSPGTIDSDYREEVGVIIINHSSDAVTIKLGDKIAQAVVTAYAKVEWDIVEELDTTERKGGFGSTDSVKAELDYRINNLPSPDKIDKGREEESSL